MARSHFNRTDRFALAAVLLLGTIWCSFGCTPATLNFLMMPFTDDKIPPKCRLANKEKEVTVVLACNFANPVTRPEILPADYELSERLTAYLKKSFEENKEKVKIVPPNKVRSFQNKNSSREVVSPREIGKHFKADYVISLEIQQLELFLEKSPMFYRGSTEINITVHNPHEASGEGLVYEETYRTEFPRTGPVESTTASPAMFRANFLSNISRELATRFTSHVPESKVSFDH